MEKQDKLFHYTSSCPGTCLLDFEPGKLSRSLLIVVSVGTNKGNFLASQAFAKVKVISFPR